MCVEKTLLSLLSSSYNVHGNDVHVCIEICMRNLKNQEFNQIGSKFHTKRALTRKSTEYDSFLKKCQIIENCVHVWSLGSLILPVFGE